jgi:hypothetical protein
VDSVPVAALSSGGVVIRGSDGDGREAGALTDQAVTRTPEEVAEAIAAEDVRSDDRSGDQGIGGEVERDSERPGGDSNLVAGNERDADERPGLDPFGFPGPPADRDGPSPEDRSRPNAVDEVARRASAVIVWDQDRVNRPVIEPREEIDRFEDRPQGDRFVADGMIDPAPERKVAIQTLAQRRHFLQCLALAIRQYGRQAGPQIEGLCRDYRIPLPFEVVQLEQRYGANVFLAGGELGQTITTLRRLGAPESYLLDQLSEQMTRAIGARHGPRNAMEARVFAARKLLAIPLPDGLDEQAASLPSIGG